MTLKEAEKYVDIWVDTNKLLTTIECVETKGGDLNAPRNATIVGDNGKANGIYQIHLKYIQDVNDYYHTKYTHEGAFIPNLARVMVIAYLARWGLNYKKNKGKDPVYETLCRIHNGGPRGHEWINTEGYWKKCQAILIQLGARM